MTLGAGQSTAGLSDIILGHAGKRLPEQSATQGFSKIFSTLPGGQGEPQLVSMHWECTGTHLAYVISPFDFVDVQLNRFSRNAMPAEAAAKDPEDPRLCQHTTTSRST